MNNTVFGKTMENVRKHRDIKLVTTDKISSKPNYHTPKWFSKMEMKKKSENVWASISSHVNIGH